MRGAVFGNARAAPRFRADDSKGEWDSMIQKRKGFTTVVDIEEFKKITWSFLTNVKLTWEYDGIANLLRHEDIPLYGFDRGTTKMNHPVATIMLPPSKDVNYGGDLYGPSSKIAHARTLVADEARIKEAAEREALEGAACYEKFDREARESMRKNRMERKRRRRERMESFATRLGFAARG